MSDTIYKTAMDPITLKMKGGTKTTVIGHHTRAPYVTIAFEHAATMDGLRATIQFELSAENVKILEQALERARTFAEDGDI